MPSSSRHAVTAQAFAPASRRRSALPDSSVASAGGRRAEQRIKHFGPIARGGRSWRPVPFGALTRVMGKDLGDDLVLRGREVELSGGDMGVSEDPLNVR